MMAINKEDFVKATSYCDVTPTEALKMLSELQGLPQNVLPEAGTKQVA